MTERRVAIAAWANERFGTPPLGRDVDYLEALQVPVGVLLRHLERGCERGARSLGWFLGPVGIVELHELESAWRHLDAQNHRDEEGAGWLRELVARYSRDA